MTLPEVDALLRDDPRTVGGYRLLGRLGAGGMATVYLGSAGSSGLGSLVAVKVIHQHLASDAEFRARFAREIELAKRVPAFCGAAVRDHGFHDERPFLVTEYVAGTSMHQLIEDEGPLDPAAVHSLAVGLAAGLTAIHDSDLVHRDLKPSNVIVTRGGVRIIDFGIARIVDVTSDFTTTGVVMGSLGWTSPEQLDGLDPMPAMDIFAWGCLVAYAATGKHPFGGTDPSSRCWRILNAEPALDGLPPALAEFVRAALDRTTERRPTAQELLLGLVGASTPVVPVGGAQAGPAVASPAGDAGSAAPGRHWWTRGSRRRRVAMLAGIPVGLALAVVLTSAAGGPWLDDDPAGAGSGTQPGVSTSSTGEGKPGQGTTPPGTNQGGGGASDTDPTSAPVLGPGVPAGPGGEPTTAPQPTTNPTPPDAGDPGNQPGPGNGNGNTTAYGQTKSKKPKG